MRRAVARGRVFPQSYSTDRRYGRLSLKACALFPLMWSNADDQGRLVADPEEIKYSVCPNIDHITKADIPDLLKELQLNKLIKIYDTPKSTAVQMLDWWDVHKPQWAWPSEYPPPDGWQDRLRYKKNAKEVATYNWPSQVTGQPSSPDASREVSGEGSGESSTTLPQTPTDETERGKRKEERERGNSPEHSGEKTPSPSLASFESFLHRLTECFRQEWGRVTAEEPNEVIPREPNARESAQLRDLAQEILAAGGCPLNYIDQAFQDAALRPGKMEVSYVRAILLDWMGIKRARAP